MSYQLFFLFYEIAREHNLTNDNLEGLQRINDANKVPIDVYLNGKFVKHFDCSSSDLFSFIAFLIERETVLSCALLMYPFDSKNIAHSFEVDNLAIV